MVDPAEIRRVLRELRHVVLVQAVEVDVDTQAVRRHPVLEALGHQASLGRPEGTGGDRSVPGCDSGERCDGSLIVYFGNSVVVLLVPTSAMGYLIFRRYRRP